MSEYNNLSESEIHAVIDKAEKALKQKQIIKRKQVISEIKKLAASIGVTVKIKETEAKVIKQGKKVAAKYRNPDDFSQTWSGRGVAPKWMQALLKGGRNKAEFLI